MREAAREPRAEVGRLLAGVENADLASAFLEVVLPLFSACFLKSLSGISRQVYGDGVSIRRVSARAQGTISPTLVARPIAS